MVLNKTAGVLAATVALSASALAGEAGGFRPGLFAGEVAVAVTFGVPQAVIGNYLSYGPQML